VTDPTTRTLEARDRVRAFLDTRAKMGGPIDYTVVHSVQRGDELHELRTADLRELVDPLVDRPASTGGMGTLTPSVVSPRDAALRDVRAAVDKALALEVRPVELFRTVLMAGRNLFGAGHREQAEADAFAEIATLADSPLAAMLLQPGQSYASRGNYAALEVVRDAEHHTYDVRPLDVATIAARLHRGACSEPWDACSWAGEDPELTDCRAPSGAWRETGLERMILGGAR
jgi:hypothetical protein